MFLISSVYIQWLTGGHWLRPEAIRVQRRIAINSMSCSTLHYQELYTTPWGKPLCKYTSGPTEICDAMILGSVMKGLRSLGLVPDFDKFILKSVSEMQKGIKGLRIEFLGNGVGAGAAVAAATRDGRYCDNCGEYYYGDTRSVNVVNHTNTCNFLPGLHQKISTAVGEIKGLSLGDFKGTEGKSAEASVGKWDLFDYK